MTKGDLSSSRTGTEKKKKEKKKEKREGGTPNVPSSVLAQQNNHRGTWSTTYSKTCRNHGLGLSKKKKQKGKKSNVPKGNKQIHMLLRKKKLLEAVLKHKHLETVLKSKHLGAALKHEYRSMQKEKKKRSSVQVEEKIETYTTLNCLYTSKPAKKKGEGKS